MILELLVTTTLSLGSAAQAPQDEPGSRAPRSAAPATTLPSQRPVRPASPTQVVVIAPTPAPTDHNIGLLAKCGPGIGTHVPHSTGDQAGTMGGGGSNLAGCGGTGSQPQSEVKLP